MQGSEPLYRIYERRLSRALGPSSMPVHVGVILDGHRRFARAEGYPDYATSYRTGMAKLEEFLGWCAQLHIPAVTAWLLSTDNLSRPKEELAPYFEVLTGLLERLPAHARRLGCSVQVIGSLDLVPAELARAAKQLTASTADPPPGKGGGFRVSLAIGYGGRQEIVDACRGLVAELLAKGVPAEELPERIDAAGVSEHCYSADLPDPDLVIRTSGETRLSGFLMWQAAYAECVFVDPYWPAFRRVDFLRALRDYARRERRFGR